VGLTETKAGLTIPVAGMLTLGIEGYLLGDIESMGTEIHPKPIGACGYPMVMAVLAGSELLGALTSDASQTNRIEIYWMTFMAKVDSRYDHLGRIAKELARNGIAHSYLTHLGVQVVRGDPARHLTRSASGELIFDCVELAAHFRESYEHARAYILDNVDAAQRRLDELFRHDGEKVRSLLGDLPSEQFPLAPATIGTHLATPVHLRGDGTHGS
jgi:hypothetical protein